MKKILFSLAGICLLEACQNELYKNPLNDFESEQGAYIDSKGSIQVFVEEGDEVHINDLKINLVKQQNSVANVSVVAGDKEQLEKFNKKKHTEYALLPAEMYSVNTNVKFEPLVTSIPLDIVLKGLKFNADANYALPIKIADSDIAGINGEKETLIVLEQRIKTKCLKMAGSGTECDQMWPEGLSVGQWTFEVMVNRSAYNANNRSIGGTKQLPNSGPNDEIFTRFGDVTIEPNQLQMKTGSSQIDVPKEKFAAKEGEWYMLAFVYDGNKHYIYVNGELVAEQEIRSGEYKLTGFWIGGANEYVREYRFWKTARTQKQLSDYAWKMVNPTDENLLVYYPCNGKKRNEDGTIVEDETKVWDWSNNAHHLNRPSGAIFDDNDGNMFVFPVVK